MLKNNLKLSESLKKSWREEVIIKSIIWNTLIWEFQEKKEIDITSYLISIRLKKNIVFIKTTKPLINSEILLIEKQVKEKSIKKISRLWLKFWDYEIKLS